ncbi:PAS domain S-box-containing protein [Halorubrum alkaliphilum]|uniref:histidine kinase n=1 Tax=Halorubrum alkaliphilum TaxID=261290 RepID=A0A8T4GB00_9EURY|nr:GAF domain-containing protein [Halorubrum alkaliphilum]MBP1921273.1 PAS domain S-box-containing protein [Halorubrum alkaliphilum]
MSETDDPIRVLHVDDDPSLAEIVATYLEREDDRIDVHVEADAEDGLEAVDREAFDCVVSDHEMPGRTGIEFLRAVREAYPDLPFLLFTGRGSESVAGEAISAGVTDYLQKGTGTEQYELLANRVLNAVESTRARRMLTERTQRLETLISTLPGLIYRCRNEEGWPMETVEGEVEELTGYSAGALERNEVTWGDDLVYSADRGPIREAIEDALADADSFEITYRIVSADGTTKWVWERGRSVAGESGETGEADEAEGSGDPVAIEGFITEITGRKERAERLERTTARLEALFENSPDMINVHDAEGRILEVNPRLCTETGYDADVLTDMRVWEIDETIDPDEARAIWDGMDVGDRLEIDGRYRRRDGSTFPVRVHARRLDIDGGDRFLVSSRDVSERRERDDKLTQLRERTRELNYTRTVAETARSANDAADEIIGAPLSGVHLVNDDGTRLEPIAVVDAVPETFDELPSYDESAPPGTRANLAWNVFRNGEPIHIDDVQASDLLSEATPASSVVLHPIGEHGLFIISSPEANAFTDTDVLLVEILANYLEAAIDRVTREETLRTRQDRLERLHDATRELVRAESRREVAERVVDAGESVLGFAVTVVRLRDPETGELVPPSVSAADDNPADHGTDALARAAFETGEIRVYDDLDSIEMDETNAQNTGLRSLMVLPVGSHGVISFGEPTPGAFDATDELLGRLLATATETALDERERQRELRRSRDELKRRNDRLAEFTDVVSHDLRNPLTVAQGQLTLAREECESDRLDAVAEAHDRMDALIEDLLTLSREGDDIGTLEPVDLASVVEACWGTVAGTDEATLVVDLDRTVRADRSRLRQLFENLLGNAVEHAGPDVTVTVGDLPDGFYVADDGSGIPEADREDVFDAGYTTATDGTGFGLSIAKRVAEAHGWAIRAGGGADADGARFEVIGVGFDGSDPSHD